MKATDVADGQESRTTATKGVEIHEAKKVIRLLQPEAEVLRRVAAYLSQENIGTGAFIDRRLTSEYTSTRPGGPSSLDPLRAALPRSPLPVSFPCCSRAVLLPVPVLCRRAARSRDDDGPQVGAVAGLKAGQDRGFRGGSGMGGRRRRSHIHFNPPTEMLVESCLLRLSPRFCTEPPAKIVRSS